MVQKIMMLPHGFREVSDLGSSEIPQQGPEF
jgi:hypothetical protein